MGGWVRMWTRGAIVCSALLSLASASCTSARAEMAEAGFGGLALRYDPAVWHVEADAEGFTARCRPDDCRDRLVEGRILSEATCRPDLPAVADEERGRGGERLDLRGSGLTWSVKLWWRGCRNAHPRSIAACTTHEGRAYRIAAALVTCRTGPLFGSKDRILTLIRSAVPR